MGPLIPRLPMFLQPREAKTLIRIGRDNDGGYIVDERNISESQVLIGLGVSDDWSFEEHFISRNQLPLYVFDANVGSKVFLKNAIKSIPRIDKPNILIHKIKTFYKYCRFFKGERHHIRKFVGMDSEPDYVSLTTIKESILPSKQSNIFFKIDIEGWEYRILDELVECSDDIEGLVVEFHDVDLHFEKIERFVGEFSLNLCHVHCNNYSPINDNGTPLVIECTFTKQSVGRELVKAIPHKLDMPNKRDKEDYICYFSDSQVTASEL